MDYTATKVEKEGTTDGKKYSHLFKTMPVLKGPGGGDAKELIRMTGEDLEGSDLNFSMGLYDQPGQWNPGKAAQIHPYDK